MTKWQTSVKIMFAIKPNDDSIRKITLAFQTRVPCCIVHDDLRQRRTLSTFQMFDIFVVPIVECELTAHDASWCSLLSMKFLKYFATKTSVNVSFAYIHYTYEIVSELSITFNGLINGSTKPNNHYFIHSKGRERATKMFILTNFLICIAFMFYSNLPLPTSIKTN